jgi:hypothetical protein
MLWRQEIRSNTLLKPITMSESPRQGTCRTKDIIQFRRWLFSGISAKRPSAGFLRMSRELLKSAMVKAASGEPTSRAGFPRAWLKGFTAVCAGPPEPKEWKARREQPQLAWLTPRLFDHASPQELSLVIRSPLPGAPDRRHIDGNACLGAI